MHKNPPCLEDNINQILLLAWKSFRDTNLFKIENVSKLWLSQQREPPILKIYTNINDYRFENYFLLFSVTTMTGFERGIKNTNLCPKLKINIQCVLANNQVLAKNVRDTI